MQPLQYLADAIRQRLARYFLCITHCGRHRCRATDFTAVAYYDTALVNNAAIIARQSRLEDLGFERMQRIFAVNSIGPILCAQQAVKRMSHRHNGQGGVIINVSSASARLGSPNEYVDYAASKGALETFTTGFAKEVAREGIRVNCIRPGHIYTEMHASGGEPGRVDRVRDSIPMGRGGQPEEVARAILWLASAEASFITGTFLDVTGGK
nr:SDR family oxidoreductase [Paraburkholderia dipogonis]